MTNKNLQELLKQYPDDIEIKILLNSDDPKSKVFDFDEEKILHTSETAYVNEDAPEDEWDCEDGKIEYGNGKRYLLFNPIIH